MTLQILHLTVWGYLLHEEQFFFWQMSLCSKHSHSVLKAGRETNKSVYFCDDHKHPSAKAMWLTVFYQFPEEWRARVLFSRLKVSLYSDRNKLLCSLVFMDSINSPFALLEAEKDSLPEGAAQCLQNSSSNLSFWFVQHLSSFRGNYVKITRNISEPNDGCSELAVFVSV